eukprot:3941557-Rhodomonas_salina.2
MLLWWYVMSGTILRPVASVLRLAYAMSGTERGYAATRRMAGVSACCTNNCRGTALYAPTPLLRGVRY